MSSEFAPLVAELQRILSNVSIDREIARGGQKIVFHGHSETLGDLAVKLYRPGSQEALDRARRELSAAESIDDPHFPRVYRSQTILLNNEQVVCVYEEFLHGESLREALRRRGHLSAEDTIDIIRHLLAALQILESRRLVHRDIKPENIHIGNGDRVVLLDLGIARHLSDTSLTADFALFGPLTPGYGAPEQVRNEKRRISTWTDIFALGVVAYECLQGQNPFAPPGTSPAQAMQNTLVVNPPHIVSPEVPDWLARVIDRCLQKAGHRRFPSTAAMLSEIEARG
jgi:serine/threonine protein kinase